MRSLHDPWTIGDLEIPNRVMLAPLAGIGNWFVRLQAKRFGAGLAVSEMISSFAIHYENRKTLDELLGGASRRGAGRDPALRSRPGDHALRRRTRWRSRARSILDLNMGCPVPKVMKTGAGAAMIKDPDLAVAVARAAREGSGLPVTVKLRASVKAGGMEGLELARRLVDEAGVAGITFHPRSAAVRHKGVPDYDLASRARRRAAGAGDRLRRDGGRRAHPLGLRLHRLRGGHAGARRTRQPVAVRPGAGRARRRAERRGGARRSGTG